MYWSHTLSRKSESKSFLSSRCWWQKERWSQWSRCTIDWILLPSLLCTVYQWASRHFSEGRTLELLIFAATCQPETDLKSNWLASDHHQIFPNILFLWTCFPCVPTFCRFWSFLSKVKSWCNRTGSHKDFPLFQWVLTLSTHFE